MNLHEELERRARAASAGVAERLGTTDAGDALVALVGRRRRHRALVATGASAACVAALVVAAVYLGPWSPGPVAPASPVGTAAPTPVANATTVIDASTPLNAAPSWLPPDVGQAPLGCGEAYDVPSGATRQVDGASRWPVTITASATLTGGAGGVFTAASHPLSWDVRVALTKSTKDLSLVAYGVVESNGVVVGSATLGVQPLAVSGVVPTREAPSPGLCAGQDNWHDSPDGDYTFHLWVQLVDANFTAVATVVDPVAPSTLKMTGIGKFWGNVLAFDGLPNVAAAPIKCGDPSPVEGRKWGADGMVSASLPAGVAVPSATAGLSPTPIGSSPDAQSAPPPSATGSSDGVWRYVDVKLSSSLVPGTFPVAQGFAVENGVVVAVGGVQTGPQALDYNEPLREMDPSAPCGVTDPSATEVYVLELALDFGYSSAQGALVVKVG